MAQMMILNPRKRGAKKKRPSAKQLAARAKFAAAARARSKKRKAAKPVLSNPRRRKRRATVKANPMKRIRRRKARPSSKRSMRWFRRRAKRNPIVPRGFMASTMTPAAIGAAGALANDIAVGYLVKRLPAALQKPELRHLVKGAAAVGLSILAAKGKVASSSTIKIATTGALTCVLHDAVRLQTQKLLPTVALGEYLSEVIGPLPEDGYGSLSLDDGMGEYLSALTDDSEFNDDPMFVESYDDQVIY